MTTAFLAITRWVEDTLRAAPALAGGDIERSRERRVSEDSDAAVRIYPQSADGSAAAVRGGYHRFTFDISVECYARAALTGADAGDVEAACDALLQAAWQRLVAAAPPVGVDTAVARPRLGWERVEASRPAGMATLTLSVGASVNNQTLALWS